MLQGQVGHHPPTKGKVQGRLSATKMTASAEGASQANSQVQASEEASVVLHHGIEDLGRFNLQ